MKNLLVYINPNKKFDKEHKVLAKIQIDNSLDLGWKKEDIVLVTNFDYEYRGVKSLVVEDGLFYKEDPVSTKIPVVRHLLNNRMIDKSELYWVHDFDVYQNEEIEVNLDGFDLGLVSYGYKPVWQCGGFFFKESSRDIFNLLYRKMLERRRSRVDEKTLTKLTKYKLIDVNRIKELNVTYNFTMRCVQSNYSRAIKPLKVLHFHPWYKDRMLNDTTLNIFMYGRNRVKRPLMSERLIGIFNSHGVV